MIKNIIFDFGDIFLNLDKPAVFTKMKAFGFTGMTKELDFLVKKYESGLISTQNFLSNIKRLYPKAKQEEIIDAWNSILLDFPEYRLEFIENLNKKNTHRLFLLSNTNDLHIEQVINSMGEKRFKRFRNCFEKFYLSQQIKMRKPNTEIYQHVLQENSLIAQETLFIDDTKENTDGAQSVGIQCWHLQVGKEDIIELTERL